MAKTPIVVALIDRDSRLHLLQTDDVQVAYVDQRVETESVVLLPRAHQMDAIMAAIGELDVVSNKTDHMGIARNAVNQLLGRGVTAAGLGKVE